MITLRLSASIGCRVIPCTSVTDAVARAQPFLGSSLRVEILNEFGREMSIPEMQKALAEGR